MLNKIEAPVDADTHSGHDERRMILSAIFLLLAAAFVVWIALIFREVYDFHSAIGHTISSADLAHTRDLLTRLPRNLNDVAFLLVFLVSAIGPGDLALRPLRLDWRDEWERILFAQATGLILYTFVVLAVGSAGYLQRGVCFALLALALAITAGCAVAAWVRLRAARAGQCEAARLDAPKDMRRVSWKAVLTVGLMLVLAFYLYIALLGGISPEFNYDARWYHLGSANSYAQHERFYNIVADTRLAVAAVDPYQTVLYAMLIKMAGLTAAKLLHYADAFLTVLVMIYFCRMHFRSTIMGLVAAIVFVSTPLVTWAMSGGGNDLQLSLYLLLSVHAFLRWRARPESIRWLVVLGIMSGYALASKLFGIYNVLIVVAGVIICGVLAYRSGHAAIAISRRIVTYLLVIGATIFICCVPWLIRTYAMTGNPVFPVLNSVFKSPYWNNYAEMSVHLAYSGLGRDQSLYSLLTLPWHAITGNNRYRAIFSPLYFLSLPVCIGLCLFSRARARVIYRLLGIYVVAWVLLWFASGALELRYALAVLPVMAMLVAFPVVVQSWPGWGGKLFQAVLGVMILVVTVLNYQPLVPYEKMANLGTAFGHTLIPWDYLYHGQPDDQVPLNAMPVIRYMNTHLSPAIDKVYDFDGLILSDAYSDITIFNGGGYDGPYGMREWTLYSPDALQHFQQNHITYLAVTKEYGAPLKRFPIWPHLQEVFRSSDGNDFLYRVNYDANMSVTGVSEPSEIDDYSFGTGWIPGTGEVNGQTIHFMEQDGKISFVMESAQAVDISFIAGTILKPLTLELRVNGTTVVTEQYPAAGYLKAVSATSVPLNAGENVLELHAVEGCTRPSDISSSPDTRCFSFIVQQIHITRH